MILTNWFSENYTLIIVSIGALLLGLASAVLGVLNVQRKQALVGDALSHATLPGVVLAFLFTNSRNMATLLIGAAISAFLAMFLLELIKKYSKTKYDASLALILSSFFGLGQVLLQLAQERGNRAAGLKNFIFGQAATMIRSDVVIIGVIAIIVIILVAIFWKEFKLFIFNNEFYQSLGFSSRITSGLLTFMTVIVVVIGIRTVGVILMSALLIAPSVASRQWSNKLSINALLAGVFGMISGLLGSIISSQKTNLPTGPVIVVVLSAFVIISLLFAPKRGIIRKTYIDYKYKKDIHKYHDLIHIYNEPKSNIKLSDSNSFLVDEGYLLVNKDEIKLTEKGIIHVEKLLGGEE